ncbi:MAG: arginine--tRNA ligase, partial [Pyrinomonadaceae bacterium]
FFYDRPRVLSSLLKSINKRNDAITTTGNQSKIIVEHTNINPNKAAHIGHLRNAVLGDTFIRILRATGVRVEVQNYIDNTGVQVADLVVGFLHIEQMMLDDVKALNDRLTNQTFDYYCWDLYARVGLFYRNEDPDANEDREKLKLRAVVLQRIESGNNPTAEMADYVAMQIVACHLNTMERLGIYYDLLPRESEILHMHFWERAFEQLKESGAIRFETEGRNANCWVMPTSAHDGTEEHDADKIIVRSNGTVTYAGKDIAYQLWKLGKLRLDFNYRKFRTYSNGQVVWITTTQDCLDEKPDEKEERPSFGAGDAVFNVIDSRQSYTQTIVRQGVSAILGSTHADEETRSVHLAYEMVALSPRACEELGLELSEEDRLRTYVEMSGRKGLGVKADDLINKLEGEALREVRSRHPDLPLEEQIKTARAIATSALRYFILKFTRNTVIAFDFNEALAFEGETGPYCQYAAVRVGSIFRKLDREIQKSAEDFFNNLSTGNTEGAERVRQILSGEDGDNLWSIVTLSWRLDETIAQAARMAEPAGIAKYTFALASAFSSFYTDRRNRIIDEPDEARKATLIAITKVVLNSLTRALDLLGIEVPERM